MKTTCQCCGKEFDAKPARIKDGRGKYCGKSCEIASRSCKPIAERFWAKVDKSGECWTWTAGKDVDGYGRMSQGKAGLCPVLAHRVSYELANGPICDESLFVCHRCDNPSCVRPDHLFLGTAKDNMEDCSSKGRSTRGEKSASAKVSEEQVISIRARYRDGARISSLARENGLSVPATADIIYGRTWKHVKSTLN